MQVTQNGRNQQSDTSLLQHDSNLEYESWGLVLIGSYGIV